MRVVASALLVLAVGGALVTGAAAQDVPRPTTATTMPPGPDGRSFADWAADWIVTWAPVLDPDNAHCTASRDGAVVLIPFNGSRRPCQVRGDQRVLVGALGPLCEMPPNGVRQRPDTPRSRARERTNGSALVRWRARYADCLAHERIRDPYLVLDGEQVPVDGTSVAMSPAVETLVKAYGPGHRQPTYDATVRAPAFLVLLEPLGAGPHTIELGYRLRTVDGAIERHRSDASVEVTPTLPPYLRPRELSPSATTSESH